MEESDQKRFAIGDVTFDRVRYSAFVDELNCWIDPPRPIVEYDETPEDHNLRFDADGGLVQFFIYPARHQLEADGEIRVTLPGRPTVVLTREELEPWMVDSDERSLLGEPRRRRLRFPRWMRRREIAREEREMQRRLEQAERDAQRYLPPELRTR
ncbi:hypothetical protein [Conexibacter arvalis]|uniref:Uncharacterized protein n=1 Tax=Conexibacter arvalis TaxID=912552 RepID=A0A840I999_9ACTN|nr:hypothetical protein [Conexibacter arvalis]MBB4661487.1 hypothetical protein [Conexibacter arvalis]